MSCQQSQPKTVLLLIDIQSGFLHLSHWGPSRSNPGFEANANALLTTYRSLISKTCSKSSSPHKIIHIMHSSLLRSSPLHSSSPGHSFQPFAAPIGGEQVIEKSVNSAFIGTDLEEVLRAHFSGGNGQGGKLYIAGLSTDHCVSTTTRMAGNLGVCHGTGGPGEVILVEDATAAWKKSDADGWFDAEIVHKVHVESLREFASIKRTEEVLGLWREWASGSDRERQEMNQT